MNAYKGHIRKRSGSNGTTRWQIIVELEPDPDTGKRHRDYDSIIGTKKDAEKRLLTMLSEINNQTFVKDSKVTVKAFLLEWLETYIRPYKSPTTTERYVNQVEQYIIPALGNKKLQDLSVINIQQFYNGLQVESPLSGKPLSPKSIRNIHMNLQAALDKAVEHGVITANPAKKAVLPKVKKYQADVYSVEEIKKLFQVAKGDRLELAFYILILLGLRRGEILALRWSNVDLDNKEVNIVENAVKVQNQRLVKEPKSESGKRRIGMPEPLVQMMKQGKTQYLLNKFKYGKDFIDSDLVVCHENGEPYTTDAFSCMIQAFIKKNGLKRIRLHDFRHSNATMMLKFGVSPKVAQKSLGHSDFNTTMNIYSHVLEDMEKEAVQKIEIGLFSESYSS